MTYLSYLCLAPSCLAPLLLGSGSLAPWLLSSLANRLPGSLSPWLGCLTPWLPGSLATLLPGCLAPWLPGSWLVGCLAPGRPETVPREDPADLGSTGLKRAVLEPQAFYRGGGERTLDPRLPPLTLARGYQDLKILDPRH